MIHSVRCNSPQFRDVFFKPGLNVILADRTKDSTLQDTRNGLGKSTLIDIVHFCFGSNLEKSTALASPVVADWTFTVDADLAGMRISISRCPSSQQTIYVAGLPERLAPLERERSDGGVVLSPSEWNKLLGSLAFGIDPNGTGKYRPSFRTLFSYFVRRTKAGFLSPFTMHQRQQEWDSQISNAFLLGLQWEDASEWQALKDQRDEVNAFRKATTSGFAHDLFGSLGELEADKVRLLAQVHERTEALSTFRVHPQYRDIEASCGAITRQLHDLSNQNVVDSRLLLAYRTNMATEQPGDAAAVEGLYREAGVVLPDGLLRTLHEVQAFHAQVVSNRRSFLANEVRRLDAAINERTQLIARLTDERAMSLRVLQSHGALDEYTVLQEQHTAIVQALRQVEAKIAAVSQLQKRQSDLRLRAELLLQRAQVNFATAEPLRDRAIALFNANSMALYSSPGNLVLSVAPTGYKFAVEIIRSRSQGIQNMKVFCYDLALAELWAERQPNLGFLIHDSLLFDGVDERQVAAAIELAASKANADTFQYICTLNSDSVPRGLFSADFDFDSYVRLRLTDSSESGALLGVRF